MALNNNDPTYKYISWDSLLVTYNNKMYQIYNSNTNKKYVYWDADNPNILQCFDKTQPQSAGFYQIFINDMGTAIERSHDDIILTWNGSNPDLISSKIYGLYEKNKDFDEKFLATKIDIDGLKTIVGTSQEDKGSLLEKVSTLEQTSDKIDLSVKEVKKEFENNKMVSELRESMNKSIINFNSSLGTFKSELNKMFYDDRVSSEEKESITVHIKNLDLEKDSILMNIEKVKDLIKEDEAQIRKIESEKEKFTMSVDNLKTYITTAISDGTVVPSEVVAITDLFSKCNIALNSLKNTLDDIIILGLGGIISEELSNINMKSDEISLTVSKKVGNDEIISSINQSAEAIKIKASKVEIDGFVTFTDLSSPGKTTIHGGNIESKTIKAESIKGGTLEAMDKILFGGATHISKIPDGLGGNDGMEISSARLRFASPHVYMTEDLTASSANFGTNLNVGVSGNGLKVNEHGEMHVGYNSVFNNYSNSWISTLTARNGNVSVAKDLWADSFKSRMNGDVASYNSDYSRISESPIDIINSFNTIYDSNKIRMVNNSINSKTRSISNPCLSVNDDGVYLDTISLLSTHNDVIKQLLNKIVELEQKILTINNDNKK